MQINYVKKNKNSNDSCKDWESKVSKKKSTIF